MSYQPQYQYPIARPARNWLDLLVKAGGLLGGVTAAAIMGAHLLHKYSPPSANAPIAQIVRYYSSAGAVGGSGHWIMEASEGSREWTRAVRYCQAQASAQDANWSGSAPKAPAGCRTIDTLAESGY